MYILYLKTNLDGNTLAAVLKSKEEESKNEREIRGEIRPFSFFFLCRKETNKQSRKPTSMIFTFFDYFYLIADRERKRIADSSSERCEGRGGTETCVCFCVYFGS